MPPRDPDDEDDEEEEDDIERETTGSPASARALNRHCDSGPASSPIRLKR